MGENIEKPLIVFSAVNFVEGGPLSIFKDAIRGFLDNLANDYSLALIVHNKNIFEEFKNFPIKFLEFKYPKKSWLLRVWFEYVHCYFISKKINPFLWVSLHDITPNVTCKNKVVYCHNPAPFYKLSLHEAKLEKSFIFFNLLYTLFYRVNIHTNKHIIVQQQWLRDEFERRFKVKNVIVAYPGINAPQTVKTNNNGNVKFQFFFPAFPRVFKNFEVLLQAAELLYQSEKNFEVRLTIDGTENKYASYLLKKYKHVPCIKFIGLQTREKMWQLYGQSSCLVFPSKLETWGLPITEMKLYNKPVLVANCRYSHETVGNYSKAVFFNPGSSTALCNLMQKAIAGTLEFKPVTEMIPAYPFSRNWKELFSLILPKPGL